MFTLFVGHVRSRLCCALIAACCLQANALSLWTGGSGNWSEGTQWNTGAAPISDSSTRLQFGGSSGYTTTHDLGNFSLNELRFAHSSGTVIVESASASQTLQFLNAGQASLPSIAVAGNGSATINAPLLWDANTKVENSGSGTLLLGGAQTYANGTKHTFINQASGTMTLADGLTYASAGSNTGLVLQVINHNTAAGSMNVGDLGALSNVTLRVGGAGTVRFAGSSAGDLFSGSATLEVLSGATFDLNGNGETMGAISGGGTISMSGGAGITISAAGYYTLSGALTGNGTLALSGSTHTLELSGSTSSYTGTTTINSGRLIVSAQAPSGSVGALGNATSEVLLGSTSGSSNASLLMGAADVVVGRNLRLQSGNTGTMVLGGLHATGSSTLSGNVTLGTNSAAAKALTLFTTPGGTLVFTGSLLRATSATGTGDALTVSGGGTVILRGGSTLSGSTTISGGLLQLDHSLNNSSKISSAALIMNGGSLSLNGHALSSTTQTVASLALGTSGSATGGGGRIVVTSGLDQNATLHLNEITRHAGATMDFNTVSTGTGIATISTSSSNTATGILGAHATFNLSGWAAKDGSGLISALAAGSYTSAFAAGNHTSLSANTALPSGGATTHSLRFTSASALTYNATPGTLVLESGGILVAAGTGTTSIGATSRRGTLSTTGELVIHQHSSSGTLTIHSAISSSGLTKTGNGTLVLTGTNTYTGNTVINGGTLSVTAAAHLGAVTADVMIHGGTLALPSGGTLGTLNAANRVITVGAAGATFQFTANQSFEGSGLAGSGNLTLTGTGIVSFGSTASTFSGHLFINNGQVRMNSPQLNNVASITVASGATYNVEDDAVDTFSLATGGRFVLNGNGVGGNGALRLTDQSPTIPRNNPTTTLNRDVHLQTTTRIQVDNGSATGSVSRLTLTGNVTGDGGLTKAGNGVLVLTARDNTYRGATLIQAGTLSLNLGHDRLPTETSVTLGSGSSSGLLMLNGYSQRLAGLEVSGTGTSNAVIGGNAGAASLLALTVTAGSQTFSGSLGGTGLLDQHANNHLGLVKDGAGRFVLGAASTYSGATTVAEGTLALGHAQSLGGGGVALASGEGGTRVLNGATLDLNGQSGVQEILILQGHGVGGAGALVNNSATPAVLGGGVASLSVAAVNTTGWSAGASLTLGSPSAGQTATATAQLGLTAQSLTLTQGGSGYGLVPTVSIAGGQGAVAFAQVGVTQASFTVATPVPGTTTQYSVAPNVTLQNGATGEAILDANGYVVGINVLTPGSGFVTTPTASFSGGTVLVSGTTPTATGNNSNYTITGITLVNAGTGFTAAPTVTITGGNGAAVVGQDGQFALQGFALSQAGHGYTTAPTVAVLGGSATVTAHLSGIVLASDASVGGSGDLTIQSVISGAASLTKVGAGTLIMAADHVYTGSTLIEAGNLQVGVQGKGKSGLGPITLQGSTAVLSGSGTVAGSLTTVVSGQLRPGDLGGAATGTLKTQALTLTPSALSTVAEWQITGSQGTANLTSDSIRVTGDLTLSSLSNLWVNGTGYTPTVGDVFDLMDWTGLLNAGGFSSGSNHRTGANADMNEGNLDLPDITGTGLWDITFGAGLLRVSVIAVVPEPSRALLVISSLVWAGLRRRRSC